MPDGGASDITEIIVEEDHGGATLAGWDGYRIIVNLHIGLTTQAGDAVKVGPLRLSGVRRSQIMDVVAAEGALTAGQLDAKGDVRNIIIGKCSGAENATSATWVADESAIPD